MRSLPRVLKKSEVIVSAASEVPLILAELTPDTPVENKEITDKDQNNSPDLKPEPDEILHRALSDAGNIIENAKADAEKILEDAGNKAVLEFESAQNSGYEAGLGLGRSDAINANRAIVTELSAFLRSVEEQKDNMLKEYEDKIKELIIGTAGKIIQTELDTKSSVFLDLYKSAVQELRDQEWIKVTVSGCESEFATSNADLLLSMVKGAKNIEIATLNIAPKGTCIVETAQGIVDASVETQLGKLQEAFLNAKLAV